MSEVVADASVTEVGAAVETAGGTESKTEQSPSNYSIRGHYTVDPSTGKATLISEAGPQSKPAAVGETSGRAGNSLPEPDEAVVVDQYRNKIIPPTASELQEVGEKIDKGQISEEISAADAEKAGKVQVGDTSGPEAAQCEYFEYKAEPWNPPTPDTSQHHPSAATGLECALFAAVMAKRHSAQAQDSEVEHDWTAGLPQRDQATTADEAVRQASSSPQPSDPAHGPSSASEKDRVAGLPWQEQTEVNESRQGIASSHAAEPTASDPQAGAAPGV